MASSKYYIRFDWAAKRLLRDKANFAVLEGFLTSLLGEKITIMEILESESNIDCPTDKGNCVDIKARNHKGEIVIIEIQNLYQMDFLQRQLFGAARAVTEQVSRGSQYGDIKKVYSIAIVYFTLGVGTDYIYKGQTVLRGIHDGDELMVSEKERNAYAIESAADIFPEYYVIRVNEFNRLARTPLEEWMEFLKNGKIDDAAQAPGLSEARELLDWQRMSVGEQRAYERYLNDLNCERDSIEQSYDEGYAKGKMEGVRETVQRMLAMGLPDEIIMKANNITAAQLANIKDDAV